MSKLIAIALLPVTLPIAVVSAMLDTRHSIDYYFDTEYFGLTD